MGFEHCVTYVTPPSLCWLHISVHATYACWKRGSGIVCCVCILFEFLKVLCHVQSRRTLNNLVTCTNLIWWKFYFTRKSWLKLDESLDKTKTSFVCVPATDFPTLLVFCSSPEDADSQTKPGVNNHAKTSTPVVQPTTAAATTTENSGQTLGLRGLAFVWSTNFITKVHPERLTLMAWGGYMLDKLPRL